MGGQRRVFVPARWLGLGGGKRRGGDRGRPGPGEGRWRGGGQDEQAGGESGEDAGRAADSANRVHDGLLVLVGAARWAGVIPLLAAGPVVTRRDGPRNCP